MHASQSRQLYKNNAARVHAYTVPWRFEHHFGGRWNSVEICRLTEEAKREFRAAIERSTTELLTQHSRGRNQRQM
jgi:hypothetical protein